MRVPAIWSPRTGRQCDTHLPALWSPLRSAPNTLPDVGTNHSVWALFFFFYLSLSFLFCAPFLSSLHLSPSSLSKVSAARCPSLPFPVCCQAGLQGLAFWPLSSGLCRWAQPRGHRPRLSSCQPVFSLDDATSEGGESAFCGTDGSGLVGAGRA